MKFECIAKLTGEDKHCFNCSLVVADKARGQILPQITVERLSLQALEEKRAPMSRVDEQDLCYTIRWTPDISMVDPAKLTCLFQRHPEMSGIALRPKTEHAALHFMRDAVYSLTEEDTRCMNWYHRRLVLWMIVAVGKSTRCLGSACPEAAHEELLCEEISSRGVEGRLVCQTGKGLLGIL